ncbi:hypothetical protein ACOSP7_024507 [Xanthoceras sorbifolium]
MALKDYKLERSKCSQEDDFFGEIDKAIAMKRDEFVKKRLIKPKKKGLRVVSEDENWLFDEGKSSKFDLGNGLVSNSQKVRERHKTIDCQTKVLQKVKREAQGQILQEVTPESSYFENIFQASEK